MTIRPIDGVVLGVEQSKSPPHYTVGKWCSNPFCHRTAETTHHIMSRAQMGNKDFAWVELEDGSVVGNLTGLCLHCHIDIHGDPGGHRAAIRYLDGTFYWCGVRDHFGQVEAEPLAPLLPQPPTPESLVGETPRDDDSESDSCPTCGHRRRKGPGTAPGPRRPRKTWTVNVPADAEDGAEVLDTLIDDLAIDLGYHDERSALRRYHTLVPVLAWTQQNKKEFLREVGA